MSYEIQSISLYKDWTDSIRYELQSLGYSIPDDCDMDEISKKYFNYLNRIIPSRSRKILKSDVFSCPSELRNGLLLLEDKIKKGENLKPNQSKKLNDLDDSDALLYDWGIFHLHLGEELQNDGYIKRTGPLLFAKFDESNAYFINVMLHGTWSQQEMLKILYHNWSQMMKQYVIGVDGLVHNLTNEEVGVARNGNVVSVIEVEPGVVLTPPGGGFVSSGQSRKVMQQHSMNKNNWLRFEDDIIANIDMHLEKAYGKLPNLPIKKLKFTMIKQKGDYYLIESNNNLELKLNQ